MAEDPLALFDAWYNEAKAAEINDPDAMALATATAEAAPSVRMVLLKGVGREGFTFYTNADSRKGTELQANPKASLLFHWKALRRQVRVEGSVTEVDQAESDAYFATRAGIRSLVPGRRTSPDRSMTDRRSKRGLKK